MSIPNGYVERNISTGPTHKVDPERLTHTIPGIRSFGVLFAIQNSCPAALSNWGALSESIWVRQ